jgi:HAD superfamily hydrolase (TIGR01509 family)
MAVPLDRLEPRRRHCAEVGAGVVDMHAADTLDARAGERAKPALAEVTAVRERLYEQIGERPGEPLTAVSVRDDIEIARPDRDAPNRERHAARQPPAVGAGTLDERRERIRPGHRLEPRGLPNHRLRDCLEARDGFGRVRRRGRKRAHEERAATVEAEFPDGGLELRADAASASCSSAPVRANALIATCVLCIVMPIRAFLFDFDGLILDTETASRAGWEWLYSQHGQELPPDKWASIVGTTGVWSPMDHLEDLVGEPLEREELNDRRYAHEISLIEAEDLRPGIAEYIEAAERHGLRRAIVSSSSRFWIDMHLERLERAYGWDAILTADHDSKRAKPNPTMYLEALELLGVDASEAIVFEDSPNGVKAARAAGIFVVAIPNNVTRDFGLDEADLVVDSLADLPPDELLARFS